MSAKSGGGGHQGRLLDEDELGGGGHIELELDHGPPSRPGNAPAPPPQMAPPPQHHAQQHQAPPAPQSYPNANAMNAPASHPQMPAPPQSHPSGPHAAHASGPHAAHAPHSQPNMQQAQGQAMPAPPPPKPRRPNRFDLTPEQRAASDLAEYGDPPEQFWMTPIYAFKVLWRKWELKQEMEEMRKTSVERARLYEVALGMADAKSVRTGIALAVAAVVFLCMLASIPVIVRFAKLAING